MDWGLLQVNKKRDKSGTILKTSSGVHLYERSKHYPLRDLLFAPPWVYYLGISANFLLRLAWVVNISPTVFGFTMKQYFSVMAFALMEVLRRSIWNFFRVENEHTVFCKVHQPIQLIAYPDAFKAEDSVDSALKDEEIKVAVVDPGDSDSSDGDM